MDKEELLKIIEEIELKDKRRMLVVNRVRAWSMGFAEAIDAWRIVPRALVAGYAAVTWKVIDWYMHIEPVILKSNCKILDGQQVCDITGMMGPSTQQAALVTAVIGAAAVIIGLYTNTGRDWHKPLLKWYKKDAEDKAND